ncbi:hypothetical protein G6L12_11655 [Agrobacterium rhizogenes]|nr:hypothetical protein [Rhizobium rhizogenes]NTF75124.1 hypothetical protein [Rhizobium rhizogenes]NTH51518.1 hypothetical protein [Rhizobium rhizogenes]NTH71102.1 hypothetical protein [Rhizobium rhizogenes]
MIDLEVDLTYFKLNRDSGRSDVKARFNVEFPQLNLEVRGWELYERNGRLMVDTPRSKTSPNSTVAAVVIRSGELRDYVRTEAIALYEREYADA